jgi:hypothetical protein
MGSLMNGGLGFHEENDTGCEFFLSQNPKNAILMMEAMYLLRHFQHYIRDSNERRRSIIINE